MSSQDRLREQAETLHAEHHPGTIVPTLDSCTEHDVEDYLTLAHEVHVEPAWPQGHGTGQFAPIVDTAPEDAFITIDEVDASATEAATRDTAQDCTACRNGVHADCVGAGCECRARAIESHEVLQQFSTKAPRLLAQWALVPGDIAQGSHSYEGTLMETADLALDRLQQVAAKEGKRLKRPVMCRVVVEAWVEDE